jgi:hypothetical protein
MTRTTAPAYVPGRYGGPRVTLTRELPAEPRDRYPYFIGTLEGTPIRYHCLDVAYVVAIRRGLAERGTVIHEAANAWLDLAIAAELPAQEDPDELVRLRDAFQAGRTGGAADGAPRKRTRKARAS